MLKGSYKSHSLYQLIGEATDNLLESENESLNKQICSEILNTFDGPKVAAKTLNKIINKSLSTRCCQSIWYCLLLLDLAVKSTDSRFCSAILAKEFFGDLVKLMDPKYQVPEFVQEKLLYLMKEWNDSLINVPGYQNLVKFQRCQTSPTVQSDISFSTQRLYPLQKTFSLQVIQPICPEKIKIIKDIEIIETNLSIFSDTLCIITPEQITSNDCQFLKDLHDILKKMQVRINEILPQVMWEDITNQLLQVNDKINSTSERYTRMMSLKIQQTFFSVKYQNNVNKTMQDIYDKTSLPIINDNMSTVIPDIYDIPSLPSYNKTSTYLNKVSGAKPSHELNLINFDDEISPNIYKIRPLPSVPVDQNNDLLLDPLPSSSDNQSSLTSEEFDNFIDSIARRHQKIPEAIPEEEHAPPFYDESFAQTSKHL